MLKGQKTKIAMSRLYKTITFATLIILTFLLMASADSGSSEVHQDYPDLKEINKGDAVKSNSAKTDPVEAALTKADKIAKVNSVDNIDLDSEIDSEKIINNQHSEVVNWVIEPVDLLYEQALAANPYTLPASHTKEDIARLYDKGLRLIQKKQYDEAIMLFSAFRESKYMNDWNFRSHLHLGYAYAKTGQNEKAVEHLSKTPAIFKTISDDLEWMIAESYWQLGQYDTARSYYRRIIRDVERKAGVDRLVAEEWPFYHKARIKEMQCLVNEGNYKTAIYRISSLIKALKADKDSRRKSRNFTDIGTLLWFKALAYKGLNNPEREIGVLQWITLKHCESFYFDEAKQRIRELQSKGVKLPHRDMETLLTSVELLGSLWQLEDSFELIEYTEKQLKEKKVSAEDEQLERLVYVKGRTLLSLRQPEKALPIFEKLLSDSNNTEKRDAYLYQLARSYSKMNETDKASEYYEKVVERYPTSYLAKSAEFLSAWHLGFDDNEWLEADKKLLEIQQENNHNYTAQKALWFRAWFAYKHKDYNRALARFNELLDEFPKSSFADACRYWSGRIHHIRSNIPVARSYYLYLTDGEDTSYYRLLAIHRLNELDLMDLRSPELDKLKNAVAKTGDKVVDEALEARQKSWKKLKKEIAINREFSVDEFRKGMSDVYHQFIAEAGEDTEARDKRMDNVALNIKDVYPDARRYVVFRNLGMQDEATEALGRLAETQYRIPAKLYRKYKRKYSGDELDLLVKRIERRKDLYYKYYLDMFWSFVGMEDFSRAFRVYIKGLNYKTRDYLPDNIREAIRYPLAYREKNQLYADEQQITDDLVFSIMRTESYFKHWVVSRVNAVGLMQIMPQTGYQIAERIGDEDFSRLMLFDTEVNIGYGAWYLKQLMVKFNNQLPLAIAAYNGGPFNVELWLDRNKNLEWDEFIESIEFSQTRNYVKKVLRTMAAYRNTYVGLYSPWDFSKKINYQYGNNINF